MIESSFEDIRKDNNNDHNNKIDNNDNDIENDNDNNNSVIIDDNTSSNSSVDTTINDSKEINNLSNSFDAQLQQQLQQQQQIQNNVNSATTTAAAITTTTTTATTTSHLNNTNTINNSTNEEFSSTFSTFDNFSTTTSSNRGEENNLTTDEVVIERSFSLGGQFKSIREGGLIEHFIVCGLSKDTVINGNGNGNVDKNISYDGKILYSYPPDKPCDPQIVNFCFPDGIKSIQVKRRNSLTELNSVLYKSLSQLEGSDSSFMFLITGQDHLLYGSCVLNTELINELPGFFPESLSNNNNRNEDISQPSTPYCLFTPRCYCVISKFPFFKSHFDFIYSIIGKERLSRVNRLYQQQELFEKTTIAQKQQEEQLRQQKLQQTKRYTQYNYNGNGNSTLNQSSTFHQSPLTSSPKFLTASSSNDLSRYINKPKPNKPLPPLPQSNLSKSSYPSESASPISITPVNVDSPTLQSSEQSGLLSSSYSSTTSSPKPFHQRIGHFRSASTQSSISHSRSQSTPITKAITNLAIQQHNNNNSNSNSNSSSINNSSNSALQDSLNAIQESLGSSNDDNYDYFNRENNRKSIINHHNHNNSSLNNSNNTINEDDETESLGSSINSFSIYNSFNNSTNNISPPPLTTTMATSSTNHFFNNEITRIDSPKYLSESNGGLPNTISISSPKPLPRLPTSPLQSTIMNHLLPPPPSAPQITISQYLSSSTNSSNSSNSSSSSSIKKALPKSPPTVSPNTTPLNTSGGKEIVVEQQQEQQPIIPKQPSLVEEEIETIIYYYNKSVPLENEKLVLQFPGDQSTTSYEAGDDTIQLERWCLSGLVKALSMKTILQVMSCILLEKYVLVTSKNIGTISNSVFAFLPLLKPFIYQGAFIPILPSSALDALYCPIPYIIGITKNLQTSEMKDALDNCYVLDIDNDQIVPGVNCTPITHLPYQDKLELHLKPYYNEVSKENRKRYSVDYPFKSIPNEYKFIASISREFNLYNRFILESIAYLIDWNVSFDFGNSTHRDQLLKLLSPLNHNFIDQFLSSQLFTSHTELLFERSANLPYNNNSTILLNHYKTNRL